MTRRIKIEFESYNIYLVEETRQKDVLICEE